MSDSRYLHFGVYRLDRIEGRLWRRAVPVPLSRKAHAVLTFLVDHAGQLVTKDSLLAAVWPRSVVVEAVLTTAVREVRRALDDRAQQPAYLQTVHGRGYRFIAPLLARDEYVSSPGDTVQPLLGREWEWEQLRQRFAAAFAGQRQVVFVAGESGIGKTTLVDSFIMQLAAESSVTLLRGQCVEHYGTGEAYLPVLEALGRLGAGTDSSAFEQLLRRHAPSWLPHLPALHAATADTAASRATSVRMLRELTEALDQLATHKPVVFVLEDLHWSDTATLDWLAYAARRRDPARLLVLATYRPVEIIVQTHPLRTIVNELVEHGNASRFILDYLSEESVARHTQLHFPGLREAATLAQLLYKRSSGHPLFLVTILETLVRDGLLERDGDTWHLRAPLAVVADLIPVSVSQFIERRIDILPPDDQRLLEAASAAGDTFPVAAIAAAAACAEDLVEARCERWAREQQFLLPAGSELWPDGTATALYRFRHALFHDVVYRRISAGRRVRLHRAIGDALARGYGDASSTIAAELAVHFEQSGNVTAAVSSLETAAQRAVMRSAYAEALGHAQKALALIERCADTRERREQELRLQLTMGTALMATRGWAAPEVEQAHRRAREMAESLGDSRKQIVSLWGLYTVSAVRADWHGTRAIARQLLELASAQKDVPFQCGAHMGLAGAALGLGELALAEEEFRTADSLYDATQHADHLQRFGCDQGVFTRAWWSHLLWQRGKVTQASAMSAQAVELARSFAHPFTLAIALAYATILRQFMRDVTPAAALARETMALCDEHGFAYYRTWAQIVLGWCEAWSEPASNGAAQISDGIAALSAASVRRSLPYFHALLAEARLRRGELAAAEQSLDTAFDIFAVTGECWWEPELWRLRAEIGIARGEDRSQCVQHLQNALELAQRCQSESLALRVTRDLTEARVALPQGAR